MQAWKTCWSEYDNDNDDDGSVTARDESPSIGGWIVWTPVIQHKEKNQTKYLVRAWQSTEILY